MIELRVSDAAPLVIPGEGGVVTVADPGGSVSVATEVGLPGPQGEPGEDGTGGGSGLPGGGTPGQILVNTSPGQGDWATGRVRLKTASVSLGTIIKSINPIALSFGIDVTFYFNVAIVCTKATGLFVGQAFDFNGSSIDGLFNFGTTLDDANTISTPTKIRAFDQSTPPTTYEFTGDEGDEPVTIVSAQGSIFGENGSVVTGFLPIGFGLMNVTIPDDSSGGGELELALCYTAAPLNPSVPDAATFVSTGLERSLTYEVVGLTL